MALGASLCADPGDPFNMAVMGLRLAGMSNGVAESCTDHQPRHVPEPVARRAGRGGDITSITNGVHAHTWTSEEMDDLLSRYVLPAWYEAEAGEWAELIDAAHDELWRVREQGQADGGARRPRATRTWPVGMRSDAAWADEVLDPRILTIGFSPAGSPPTSRRTCCWIAAGPAEGAAAVARAAGADRQPARRIHDEQGKEMIRQIIQFSTDPEIRHRMTFVASTTTSPSRTAMYQGCDVWPTTHGGRRRCAAPAARRQVSLGQLNCSILDGWWDEMFGRREQRGDRSSTETYDDLDRRRRRGAGGRSTCWSDRSCPVLRPLRGAVPRRWVRRVKASLRSLAAGGGGGCLRRHVEQLYDPIAPQADALSADGHARAGAGGVEVQGHRRVVGASGPRRDRVQR